MESSNAETQVRGGPGSRVAGCISKTAPAAVGVKSVRGGTAYVCDSRRESPSGKRYGMIDEADTLVGVPRAGRESPPRCDTSPTPSGVGEVSNYSDFSDQKSRTHFRAHHAHQHQRSKAKYDHNDHVSQQPPRAHRARQRTRHAGADPGGSQEPKHRKNIKKKKRKPQIGLHPRQIRKRRRKRKALEKLRRRRQAIVSSDSSSSSDSDSNQTHSSIQPTNRLHTRKQPPNSSDSSDSGSDQQFSHQLPPQHRISLLLH